MKNKSIIISIVIGLFLFLFAGVMIGSYFYTLKPVDKNSKEPITFLVNKGEATNIIISNLKKQNLIKSETSLKIYTKLNPGVPLAGSYLLNKSMSAIDIYEALIEGKVTLDTRWVTFVEGKRLTNIAEVISNNFEFTYDEVMSELDNKEYIKTLIEKYDFLTEDILNDKIYHPLEGYLFPDTYEFSSTSTLKEIIERMLDNTESKLSMYSNEIESSSLSIHEIMTLSSIIELEGARSDDRRGVAGVFYNRLNTGMTLGSDVTTYYAVNKDFQDPLYNKDLNSCNGYNTRGTCVKGLPAGPIANFSIDSLKATLDPKEHDYYFFVADKNMKTYFSKTDAEHVKITNELKSKGLWYE